MILQLARHPRFNRAQALQGISGDIAMVPLIGHTLQQL